MNYKTYKELNENSIEQWASELDGKFAELCKGWNGVAIINKRLKLHTFTMSKAAQTFMGLLIAQPGKAVMARRAVENVKMSTTVYGMSFFVNVFFNNFRVLPDFTKFIFHFFACLVEFLYFFFGYNRIFCQYIAIQYINYFTYFFVFFISPFFFFIPFFQFVTHFFESV